MIVVTEYLHLSTKGNTDIVDITQDVQQKLSESKLMKGTVTVSVIGSTGSLTTCEYEPGLVQDLKDFFQKIIPSGHYCHDQAWGDGNGHAHLRASLLGPSLTIPFCDARLVLGTWQQIIFLDFDNRARQRKIVLQLMGTP
jgi:secondary thiamine-phosphate synthase enzyme